MALVLGTNCYVALDDANAYFLNRIDTDAWDTAVDTDKEKALMTATFLLDDRSWIGAAVSPTQALAWPRTGAVYLDPRLGQLTQLREDVYPDRVKWATYELAYHLLLNENVIDNTSETFESIKIGSISITDNSEYQPTPVIPLRIKKLLEPLIVGGSNRAVWRYN